MTRLHGSFTFLSSTCLLGALLGAGCATDDAPGLDITPDAGMSEPEPEPEPEPEQAQPSNADAIGGLEATGLVIAPPAGTFDTSLQCTRTSALGRCTPVSNPGAVDLCVCRMDEVTIGNLQVTGSRGLVLLAYKRVVVTGHLSVSARGAADGPGAYLRYVETHATNRSGAAGGSFGSRGGNASSNVVGTDALVPLVGGSAGQATCSANAGGAGGALQITAGEALYVSGVISAAGAGRHGGSGTCLGGAGGGSGGAVLLEAPLVQVNGVVAANGGGGGGGGSTRSGSGYTGAPGRLSASRAEGGEGKDGDGCFAGGYTYGGDGGWGASAVGAATNGVAGDVEAGCAGSTIYLGDGGGGGGTGRIRVNTATGCQCGGTFSPAASIGDLVVR